MTKLYDKEIIAELNVNLFNQYYKVTVLDNNEQDTYDIHIITDRYSKDELNTLFLQEPKDTIITYNFDRLYLMTIVTEFALWDNLYGYKNKVYSFSINIEDEYEL